MDKLNELVQLARCVSRLEYKQVFALNQATLAIHPSQFRTLLMLEAHDGCSQKTLADALRVAPATVGVSVKRLEREGFLRREPDPADARTTRVFITQRGREVCCAAHRNLMSVVETEFADFSPQDIDGYIAFLRRIENNLKKEKENAV